MRLKYFNSVYISVINYFNLFNPKMHRNQENKKLYNHPDGPYKVITLLSLSQNINTVALVNSLVSFIPTDDFIYNGVPFYDTKNKTNNLLIPTENLSQTETLYAIRTADLVVFFIDKGSDDTNLSFYKKHLPSYIFCVMDNSEKKTGLSFAKKYFSSDNLAVFPNLFDKISHMKTYHSSVTETRPYFVPLRYVKNGDVLHAEGFVRRGFLSRNFIMNGLLRSNLTGLISGDTEYEGDFIDENINISEFYQSREVAADEEESASEGNEEFASESSDESHGATLNNAENLVQKYSDYKGIKNLHTCDFVTNEYPEHYQSILLFDHLRDLESKIRKFKSKLRDEVMVSARFKISEDFNHRFIAFFNTFEIEDIKTMCNMEFLCSTEIESNEKYVIDLGHKFLNIVPLLSYNSQAKVHRAMPTLGGGVMSFIAPLSFGVKKVLIYNGSVSPETLLGIGQGVTFRDRVIVDEVLVKGTPHKIDKRYCTVRNMFTTKDEVMYFRNIELRTKKKVKGIIKKAIGTHGIFKAYFSQPINHGDVIMLPLYKRIFLEDNE